MVSSKQALAISNKCWLCYASSRVSFLVLRYTRTFESYLIAGMIKFHLRLIKWMVILATLFLRCAIAAVTVFLFRNWIHPLPTVFLFRNWIHPLPTIPVCLSIPRPTLRVEFDGMDCTVLNNTSVAAEITSCGLHSARYELFLQVQGSEHN